MDANEFVKWLASAETVDDVQYYGVKMIVGDDGAEVYLDDVIEKAKVVRDREPELTPYEKKFVPCPTCGIRPLERSIDMGSSPPPKTCPRCSAIVGGPSLTAYEEWFLGVS